MSLDVNLIKKPYEVSFSNNPISFVFALSPYGSTERSQDIRLSVRIQIEDLFLSDIWSEVYTQTYSPNNDGIIEVETSSIIHPYLEYYTPRPTLAIPIYASNQRKRYRILYLLQKDGLPVGTTVTTPEFYAIKGGISNVIPRQVQFFEEHFVTNKKPLFYSVPGEKTSMDELRFMYWIYPIDDATTQTVKFKAYLDDNTTVEKTFGPIASQGKWAIYCCPAGFNQIGLDALVPDGKLAVKYSFEVYTNTNPIVSPVFLKIDHRNFYETYQILYRCSLGSLETIRLRGKIDFEPDYERQQAVKTQPPSSFTNLNLQPSNITAAVEEQSKYKGDTGFLPKAQIEKLRDLLLSNQVMQYTNGVFLPVIINSKTVKFFSSRDTLFSVQLDWAKAFTEENYTPENILGQAPVCPAVEVLVVKQRNKNQLQIIYSIPSPYDRIEFEINNTLTVETFRITGNHGSITKSFTNPVVDNPVDIVIRARVICDETSDPINAGPYSAFNLAVNKNSLPIANDDTFTIAIGYNTAIELPGTVLTNDYDPDGDSIECVADAGATTQGGAYSINAAGKVTYTPPSSIFVGVDTFPYEIREVGGVTTVSATVRITVGNASIGVFVKKVLKNINSTRSDSGAIVNETTGEIWAEFFAEPSLTQRLDVTPLNLDVNYTLRETVMDHNDGPPGTVTTQNLSFTPVGDRHKLFEGTIYSSYQDAAWPYADVRSMQFTLEDGTGYTIL